MNAEPKMGVYVGTTGTAVWMSNDAGESWLRPYSDSGLYMESRVWSLTSQPAGGPTIVAGTDRGIYRWHRAQMKWEHLPSALDETSTYTIAQSPHDPGLMLAGTQPPDLYRSTDAGSSWTRLPVPLPQSCELIGIPRITQILFDRDDPQLVWVGVEIGGVYRSRDAGLTWEKTSSGMVSEDLHGLAAIRQDGRRKLFATTNKGLHVSLDDGDHWTHRPLEGRSAYLRAIMPKADDDRVVFMTNGNGPPGSEGRLLRSEDHGESWTDAHLPGELNSTPWIVAVHPAVPELVFACTALGQLFRSDDGGRRWTKLKREFGEIRSLLLRPLEAPQAAAA